MGGKFEMGTCNCTEKPDDPDETARVEKRKKDLNSREAKKKFTIEGNKGNPATESSETSSENTSEQPSKQPPAPEAEAPARDTREDADKAAKKDTEQKSAGEEPQDATGVDVKSLDSAADFNDVRNESNYAGTGKDTEKKPTPPKPK